jgi:serine/threonine protein kinase
LERDIRALLPGVPFKGEHVNAHDVLKEESLEELRALLKRDASTKPWSASPRIYALLRVSATAGEEDLTERLFTDEELLAHCLSDYALPFSEATLPAVVRERPATARRILNLQSMVKSSPESMSFKDDVLTHRNSKVPPFSTTRQLPATQGSFGQVESVINTRSGFVFARKIISRSRDGAMSDSEAQADRQWRLRHFKNEVEILQKLNHKHLLRFCGSYTDENTFALLVQPVAERTLHDLLIQTDPLGAEDRVMMRKSFGCLALSLAWLHSRLIRHKDIKPANILISAGSMLFCDFGSAMDAELLDTTRTEGPALMRTPRYVSPETHEQMQRNEASDIWSLGCVFLEILTVLGGRSVDDLLGYIHHELDRPGPMHDVCYWEGAPSNTLQSWTAQTAQAPELHFMADWTKQMVGARPCGLSISLGVPFASVLRSEQVERSPEARPSAATLVEAAQSHQDAHPEFGHIGSCCAESEIPALPEPRQSQSSPPVSPRHRTSRWVSVNSTPTTGWRGPDEGITTADPLHATRVRTESTHSRVDSARLNAGQSKISEGPLEGELVFQAPLTSDSFQILEPRRHLEEALLCARSLRLYDLLKTDLYQTTRRLVFLRSEDADIAERQEFWMPLADTAVVRRGGLVIISWSDCNHLESHATMNGITPHSRVYRRMRPNNALLIHFALAEDARLFASHIKEPREAKSSLRGWPINLSPYATSGAWGFNADYNIRKFSVSPEVTYTVQPFDYQTPIGNGPSLGLLVKADNDLTTSTSRMYWLPAAIDIKLGMDYTSDLTESKPSVILMDLFVAGYKSNVLRVHSSERNRIGACQEVGLSTCSVSWRFENAHGIFVPAEPTGCEC